MTEEQATELGKRAVAAGLSMMVGMLIRNDKCDIRIESVYPDVILYSGACSEEMAIAEAKKDFWPDFRDAATLGCLLINARLARNAPGLFARPTALGWAVMRGSGAGIGKVSDGETEVEALVACLEAAKEGKR